MRAPGCDCSTESRTWATICNAGGRRRLHVRHEWWVQGTMHNAGCPRMGMNAQSRQQAVTAQVNKNRHRNHEGNAEYTATRQRETHGKTVGIQRDTANKHENHGRHRRTRHKEAGANTQAWLTNWQDTQRKAEQRTADGKPPASKHKRT